MSRNFNPHPTMPTGLADALETLHNAAASLAADYGQVEEVAKNTGSDYAHITMFQYFAADGYAHIKVIGNANYEDWQHMATRFMAQMYQNTGDEKWLTLSAEIDPRKTDIQTQTND